MRKIYTIIILNINNMKTKIKHTLKRWESSLLNFGKIDQWKINEDFAVPEGFDGDFDFLGF